MLGNPGEYPSKPEVSCMTGPPKIFRTKTHRKQNTSGPRYECLDGSRESILEA